MSASHQGSPKRLPANPSVENLKKQAKLLARSRPALSLQQAQHQLAKSYGCTNWAALLLQVAALQESSRTAPDSVLPTSVNEERRRHEGSRHWLDGIAPLEWNKTGQCTVIASLSAALSTLGPEASHALSASDRTLRALPAQTGPAWDYNTLMGDSAMAFRLRWHRRGGFRQTSPRPATWWAFTMAYAFGQEAEALLQRATGWRFEGTPYHYPNNARPLEQLPGICASIERGLPVVACFPEEFGVIQGYDTESNEVMVTAYQRPGQAFWMPITEVGTMVLFLASFQSALPRPDAVLTALHSGLFNWSRGEVPVHDVGIQWEDASIRIQYGATAYEEWSDDLLHADSVSERSRRQLREASVFNVSSLGDARWSAAGYLRQSQAVLPRSCQPHLTAAADIYEDLGRQISELRSRGEEFFSVWTGRGTPDWSDGVRQNEAKLLERFAQMDAMAMAEIQRGIGDLPIPEVKSG